MGTARYEFRVWGRDLAGLRSRLAGSGRTEVEAERQETYVLAPDHPSMSAKIRDGSLEVKVLLARHGPLEQWQPQLKAPFPLARALLVDSVLPLLGVTVLAPTGEAFSAEAFLSQVVAPHPDLRSLRLVKRRTRYRLEPCRAEYTEVGLLNGDLASVAVEAAEPGPVLAAVERFGLAGRRNEAYPRALMRAIGLANGPEDAPWESRSSASSW